MRFLIVWCNTLDINKKNKKNGEHVAVGWQNDQT